MLEREVKTIESLPEWMRLGTEHQDAFSARLDKLNISVSEDLDGIRKLLNHQFTISTEVERIKGGDPRIRPSRRRSAAVANPPRK